MEKRDLQIRSFAFFSANLHQLLPHIPYEEHGALFQQADHYGQLALDETQNRAYLDTFSTQAHTLAHLDEPGIIATFHTGPYRLLPMWLAQQGLPITAVLSADIARGQQERRLDTQRFMESATGRPIDYEVIHAENPMVLRQLVNALRQGRFVVIYVDGQTGAEALKPGQRRDHRGSMVVEFMGRAMRIRTGVAELARLSGRPIYPMIMGFDDSHQPSVEVGETLSVPTGNPDPQIIRQAMEKLYAYLEWALQDKPMQWEGWYHVHQDLEGARDRPTGGLLRHYLPFRFAGRYFLLHKDSLSVQTISEPVYHKLSQLIGL